MAPAPTTPVKVEAWLTSAAATLKKSLPLKSAHKSAQKSSNFKRQPTPRQSRLGQNKTPSKSDVTPVNLFQQESIDFAVTVPAATVITVPAVSAVTVPAVTVTAVTAPDVTVPAISASLGISDLKEDDPVPPAAIASVHEAVKLAGMVEIGNDKVVNDVSFNKILISPRSL